MRYNIGRPGIFGNPFIIGRDGTREEVINKHYNWILLPEQKRLRQFIRDLLKGIELYCPGCKDSLPCHRMILETIANSKEEL